MANTSLPKPDRLAARVEQVWNREFGKEKSTHVQFNERKEAIEVAIQLVRQERARLRRVVQALKVNALAACLMAAPSKDLSGTPI